MSDVTGDADFRYQRPHRAPPDRTTHVVSPKTQAVGMWLFLLGLALLFLSGMLAYVVIRYQMTSDAAFGAFRGDIGNWKLAISTVIVLAASFTIHRAMRQIQRERQDGFKAWLWVTNVLAVLFVVVQTPAMIDMLSRDVRTAQAPQQVASPFIGDADPDQAPTARDLLPAPRDTRLWAILFFFVLVHALHVLGGMIYLAVVTIKAHKHYYDHEHYVGVRHAALYWHFLDGVWLIMLGTFLALG